MKNITLYHYVSREKFSRIQKEKILTPTAPFNSGIPDEDWLDYTKQFPFPLARYYTCCFFEPSPEGWKEYGLFDLLMEEFSGGDYLLKFQIESDSPLPILVRDHKFHSPKEYGFSPEKWRKRKVRNSRPDLRQKWYDSTLTLQEYKCGYVCPEVLVPFEVPLAEIEFISQQ